jgi:S-disulfanyl-L-cysteine oxidoreductase SoxD
MGGSSLSRIRDWMMAMFLLLAGCRPPSSHDHSQSVRFGVGRAATVDEIGALDIDVRPDGTGLPHGVGTSADGARIYRERCSGCHGSTGREGPNDVLVSTEPAEGYRLAGRNSRAPPMTIGNCWPYATTVFDYVRRAMPWQAPGSLTADETYSVVAWLLVQNRVIPPERSLDEKTLPVVRMPAADRFIAVDRVH